VTLRHTPEIGARQDRKNDPEDLRSEITPAFAFEESNLQAVSADGSLNVFCIDGRGYILWASRAIGGFLQRLGVFEDQSSWDRIQPSWNNRLWELISVEDPHSVQCKLINSGHAPGYAGIVIWSGEAPDRLNVCFTPLASGGIDIDPLWDEILQEGVVAGGEQW